MNMGYVRKFNDKFAAVVQSDAPGRVEFVGDIQGGAQVVVTLFAREGVEVIPEGEIIYEDGLACRKAQVGIYPQDRADLIALLKSLLNHLEGIEQSSIEDKLQEVAQ
jgi:hypothetical protein